MRLRCKLSWRYHDVQSGSGRKDCLGIKGLDIHCFPLFSYKHQLFRWGMFGVSKALHWTMDGRYLDYSLNTVHSDIGFLVFTDVECTQPTSLVDLSL